MKLPDWTDRVSWLTWPVVLVVIQQIWFPAPAGAILAGVILGLITSLVSLGMYLVYRANRVLNFTAGELGLLPAVLSVMLIIESGLSWYLGLGLGFAAAAVLGVAVEFLIIRRFFEAPRLVVTVATIGVAQLLGVGALFLPGWWGARVQSQRIDAPFDIDFEIGTRVFNANHVVALVLAPLAMLAVGVLLRSTRIGIAIRAAAELPSRAAMLGIPVKGLQSIVWSVATMLGFIALFLRSGIYGLPVGGALGLLLLLRSLAALTLGRLIHLPTIIAASLALGVLQEAVVWNSGSIEAEAKMGAITGVVIVAGLLFRRTRGMRSEIDTSSWQNAGDVRPIADVYRSLPIVRIGRVVGIAAVAVAFLAFPEVFGTTVVVRMALIFLFAITLMSLGVLTGWAGQLSLGQLAFSSIGAATSAWLTQRWHWDITLTTLVAGVIGALVSLVVGVPALRLRGAYLAVTTLAFAITVSQYFLNPRFFDWLPTGRIERNPIFGVIDWSSSRAIYYVSLIAMVLAFTAVRGIRHSRTGRVLIALRDNEAAVESYGVSPVRAKLTAFAISGFLAAFSGSIFVHHQQALVVDDAQFNLLAFSAGVIGGLGSPLGAFLGSLYFNGTFFWLRGSWRLLASGIGLLGILLVAPGGLTGLWYDLRDLTLRWFGARRGIVEGDRSHDLVDVDPDDDHDADDVAEPVAAMHNGHRSGDPSGNVHLDEDADECDRRDERRGGGDMTDTIVPEVPHDEEPDPEQGWLRSIAGDGPIYALLILFGLNAVDELDRTAFAILAPEIRDEFELGFTGLLTLIAAVLAFALALQVPIAGLADRSPRVRLALIGATVWACFSFTTGLATGIVMLGIARSGSAIGKAVNDPTHNSLIADWFEPGHRPKVYSFHRAANAVGAIVGPITAGLLAYQFGWRAPFLVFAVPTLVLVVLGLRLREPVRGAHERRLAGGDAEAQATEEAPPSYAEAWRMCWKIESLRRIFVAMPFLAVSLIGFGTLASLLYEEAYNLDERARGVVAATSEPGQLIGLLIGASIATKLMARDPSLILKFLAVVSAVTSALSLVFAVVPNLGVAIAVNFLIALCLAIVGPGILASLSLAIPPRARSMGFSMASLWILPGLLMLPFIGWIADSWGIRTGMAMMVPVFLLGGLVIASGGNVINNDIAQVRSTALARAEVINQRRRGEVKLLLCRGVNVGYSGVRVLHDVDFEIDEGSVVALLGTNGAGKSTLLKAISGVVEADQGAIIFDGRDITHAPPNEIAGHGIVQIPGGHGVFPGLTVQENLDAAGWLNRGDHAALDAGMATVLETFPALADRLDEPAANLSGGQQQMLALGMSFLVTPRLLMIDELSLGLAPVIVEQLLAMVRKIAASGVTVILVEQSVNVALELADTAYFMERGRIRFHGPTTELVARDDLLRSVFLGDTVTPGVAPSGPSHNGAGTPTPHDAPPDASMALSVRGLSRRFGGLTAVNQVDVDVAEHEIVGFIGPNGAGKTTLFDLIGGTTPADAGRVELGGLDLTSSTASERARSGLGRSFQDARLFPSLTVEETISVALERWISSRDPVSAALHLPAAFDSETEIAGRVAELIELMNLGPYRHKRIRELSTGSRRIVDLACVVAHRPTVVLLDEPSSGIAQREVEALGPVIERMRTDMGSALLVIEHDMNLLRSIADRIVAMDQGSVIADGRPDDVLADPAVVASYLGTDPTAIHRSNSSTTN